MPLRVVMPSALWHLVFTYYLTVCSCCGIMSPIVSLCLPGATLLFSIIPVCYVMVYTSPCDPNKQSILVMTLFVYSGKCWPSPCLKRAASTRLWGITPSENWILPGVTTSDETWNQYEKYDEVWNEPELRRQVQYSTAKCTEAVSSLFIMSMPFYLISKPIVSGQKLGLTCGLKEPVMEVPKESSRRTPSALWQRNIQMK